MNQIGHARISSLHRAHILDTNAARQRALEILDSPQSPLPELARRFSEIIIDEFQDCDELEHRIVARLKEAGIHVVAVADPDQAIYEFRQANSALYERYRASIAPDQRAALTTCYRSTPVICSLVNDLRIVGTGEITPDPEHFGGPDAVHVVVGSGIRAGAAGFKILRQTGVSLSKTRVIAHRRSDARALLRAGKEPPHGTSQIEPLLVALADLRSRLDPRGRLRAIRNVEAYLLNQFDWPDEPRSEGRAEQLDLLGITPEQLRVLASQLLKSSQDWGDIASCKTSIRTIVEGMARDSPIGLIPRLGSRLTVPNKVWQFWVSRTEGAFAEAPADSLRWGHVHGVKGDEFEGVIFALPSTMAGSTHVLDDWRNGANTEQRRVLYVGVSRAMRVLVMVVPPARRSDLEYVLTTGGIRYTVTVA
ncbi:hypothetical protein QQ25_02535 [Mycolicibacterium setense]|nr:hypothetical protein QQ25_02535 [Mycolicibacterium setense]